MLSLHGSGGIGACLQQIMHAHTRASITGSTHTALAAGAAYLYTPLYTVRT